MIARIWQGLSRPGMGKAYYEYLESAGLKDYWATKGLQRVLILTQNIGDQTEYVVITLWDDMDAVRRFAGPDPEKAVYYPDDNRYFAEEELRPTVAHYEVRTYPE